MINFHPSRTQLKEFANGICEPGLALVLSAHIDMCSQCSSELQGLQTAASKEAFDSALPIDANYERMMDEIIQLPIEQAVPVVPSTGTIELDGKFFTLPRALQRYVKHTGNWSKLVGKTWQAPVQLGDIGRANFIYMEKGGGVPEHTHKGSEITLVIDGQYEDGMAMYDVGDFTLLDSRHKHMPNSQADDGCLVFSIVDKPLHFTSGIARLLNPFSHLFF